MYKDIPQSDCGCKSSLWQNAVQDSQTVSFSAGCVSCVREGYSERACRENYVDQNVFVVSVLFCPHLNHITVLWPCKRFPHCDVPSGPSVLKGVGCSPVHLEVDL